MLTQKRLHDPMLTCDSIVFALLANARTPDDVSLEPVQILAPHVRFCRIPRHLVCKAGASPSVAAELLALESSTASRGHCPFDRLHCEHVARNGTVQQRKYPTSPVSYHTTRCATNVDIITNHVHALPDSLTPKTTVLCVPNAS